MSLGVIARAVAKGLAHLGEASLLNGVEAGKVNIEHNVTLSPGMLGTAEDNHVANASVATILAQYAPKAGQLLQHPDGNFRLDRKVEFTGYVYRFIVVKVP